MFAVQIFDKALTEPTFSLLYSGLCADLNKQLPEFEPSTANVGSDGKPLKNNFRYILLNKCQAEFEKGAQAKAAVENREKAGGAATVRFTVQLPVSLRCRLPC